MKQKKILLIILLLIASGRGVNGQQTVFELFRRDVKLGDEYYNKKDYHGALQLYLNAEKKRPSDEIHLRMARCYYFLKDYVHAADWYDVYLNEKHELPDADLYLYAEIQATLANYGPAIEYYQKYLLKAPENELVASKIWRLSNIRYLYEDSMHFTVKPVSFNTESGELCATLFRDQLVFMSNRKEPQLVEKVNASLNSPFYKVYSSEILPDTTESNKSGFGKVASFDWDFSARFNAGPVIFYDSDQKMVFASSANNARVDGSRTLQLYFSGIQDGKWSTPLSFPYNSDRYSISDPAVSDDGKTLFFSSDMEGGFGGKDLYRSTFSNGEWSPPVNLGKTINTPQDEVFPHLHRNSTLYFSSNGQPGMGGLDIFYSVILDNGFSEPENMGYPINSSYDDFGISIDSLGIHGFLSSNRKSAGYDDDIYEFDMDLQAYPVTINGIIKYKEHHLNQLSEAKVLAHARIFLIDDLRNKTIYECVSDELGNFSIVVPYFSTYIVRVVGLDNKENDVALEIPRFRTQVSDHEIVIIKDIF